MKPNLDAMLATVETVAAGTDTIAFIRALMRFVAAVGRARKRTMFEPWLPSLITMKTLLKDFDNTRQEERYAVLQRARSYKLHILAHDGLNKMRGWLVTTHKEASS